VSVLVTGSAGKEKFASLFLAWLASDPIQKMGGTPPEMCPSDHRRRVHGQTRFGGELTRSVDFFT
jgi:hypothetical protein